MLWTCLDALMARPLRLERPGGRYHVTARGNERQALFRARLGGLPGEMGYAAVGQALRRFGKRLEKEAQLRAELRKIESQL